MQAVGASKSEQVQEVEQETSIHDAGDDVVLLAANMAPVADLGVSIVHQDTLSAALAAADILLPLSPSSDAISLSLPSSVEDYTPSDCADALAWLRPQMDAITKYLVLGDTVLEVIPGVDVPTNPSVLFDTDEEYLLALYAAPVSERLECLKLEAHRLRQQGGCLDSVDEGAGGVVGVDGGKRRYKSRDEEKKKVKGEIKPLATLTDR